MMTKKPSDLGADADSRALLYVRVRDVIRRDIATGGYAPGDRYLTESELAAKLDVGRNTIRRAMKEIENAGQIKRIRRVGTIIQPRTGRSASVETRRSPARHRLIVVFPGWDDTTEGHYAGKLLLALSSPKLSPRFAVEFRHYNDPIEELRQEDATIVPIDPKIEHHAEFRKMVTEGKKVVLVEPHWPVPGVVNLYADHRAMVVQAVKHLYSIGHKAVGIINGCLDHIDNERSMLGYLDAHAELNKPIPLGGIVQHTIFDKSRQCVPDVVNISGWVCSFLRGVGSVADECRRHNKTIPEDVSVISLDDPGDAPVLSFGRRLCTVASDPEAAAAMIHNYVHDWLADKRREITFISHKWIERETVAPPRNVE
ncbi:MAG: GntR family transcriptional regulator [Planctomycetes bacterium]|nr:GntR family transcriptional regulator [Planctomycetota bacterium]